MKIKGITLFLLLFLILFSIVELYGVFRDSGTPDFLNVEGVNNFCMVNEMLYRSGQPSAEGMKNIEEMGIRTVVDLRIFHNDSSKITGTNLTYEHIPMTPWPLSDSDAIRFLEIVTDTSRSPVLVHCYRGSDRTGTMVALYRIVEDGWSKDDAIEEMTHGGFGFKWYLMTLTNWIRNIDEEWYQLRLTNNE